MMELWSFWPTLVLICIVLLWHDCKAEPVFTIDWVKLTPLPGASVERGSNLTIRCEIKVTHSSSELMHTVRFLMDNRVIYSKNTSEDVVEYSLSPARASHSGRYSCHVKIFKKEKSSETKSLTVKGLQTPELTVQTNDVYEGETFLATCSAPEETGGLNIYFYKNNEELQSVHSKGNSGVTNVTLSKIETISLHCNYMLMLHPKAGHSNNSKIVNISVRELEITPSIKIYPKADVVEGDRIRIMCNVSYYSQSGLEVFLIKDTVLHKDHRTFSHSFVVRANDSGEYVCKTERGNVQKSSAAQLQVEELFSRPTLTKTPKYVFEEQPFNLSCISKIHVASIDVTYRLYKDKKRLPDKHIFSTSASKANSGSYYCEAEAKGITKASMPLIIDVKVPVSTPVIKPIGKVIIGKPFLLHCESEYGTLPITYSLLKFQKPVAHMTVIGPLRTALFNISSINYSNESQGFSCQAENQGPGYRKNSLSLNTPVIEPVSRLALTLNTKRNVVTEGMNVILNCSVHQGTTPITFTWYRDGAEALTTIQINKTQAFYNFKSISRADEGHYYCQASNEANQTKDSLRIPIRVNLVGWKKALIGVSCVFLLLLIVIILVIFLKKAHTPRKNKRTAALSVKPKVHTKSNDPMRVSLTLDIEDNTAGNATPGIMGRNVWSDHVSSSESDEENKKEESEEMQHADELPLQNVNSGEELVSHNTDTVNGDLQDITQDEVDQVDTDLEYVHLNNCELEPE